MKTLELCYAELNNPIFYKKVVKKRIAKIVLGASVIRAFKHGTKPNLLNCLINLDINSLLNIESEADYDKWHTKKITSVYNCLFRNTKNSYKGYYSGLKWGHATKVFNLFIGHLFYYSPYFNKKNTIKANRYFHVPLDSKVFSLLKELKIIVPKSIKTLNVTTYRRIQNALRVAAQRQGVEPLRFDDYAWVHID